MRPIPLFTLSGLRTTISPFGILCHLAAIPLLAWAAARWLSLSVGEAALAGALSAIVLFLSEWLHQWGHARAACRVGYPMEGMLFNSLFSISIYPKDEPPLPPRVHIRRALGGFSVNLLIGLLVLPAALYLWPRGGAPGWLAGFTFAWNFLGGGLGALLPIDLPGVFTLDSGTIWHYWRELKRG